MGVNNMDKKIFYIADIKDAKEFLNVINSIDLNDIQFQDENDKPIVIDQKIIDDFKFTGLSNCDFILTEFYKTGYDNVDITELKT